MKAGSRHQWKKLASGQRQKAESGHTRQPQGTHIRLSQRWEAFANLRLTEGEETHIVEGSKDAYGAVYEE